MNLSQKDKGENSAKHKIMLRGGT